MAKIEDIEDRCKNGIAISTFWTMVGTRLEPSQIHGPRLVGWGNTTSHLGSLGSWRNTWVASSDNAISIGLQNFACICNSSYLNNILIITTFITTSPGVSDESGSAVHHPWNVLNVFTVLYGSKDDVFRCLWTRPRRPLVMSPNYCNRTYLVGFVDKASTNSTPSHKCFRMFRYLYLDIG